MANHRPKKPAASHPWKRSTKPAKAPGVRKWWEHYREVLRGLE